MRWALIGLSLIFMLSLLLVCSQQPTLSANHGQTTQDILSASPSQSELLAEGVTDSEILIGMSAAFTGASHSLGIELYRGAMAYFVEINRSGGVHGRKIVLKAYDDGYQPDQAVKNTLKLMLEDRVFLLFDYVGTPTVTRVLPLLKKYDRFGVGAFLMSKILAPLLLSGTKGDLVPVFFSLGVFFAAVLIPVTSFLDNPPPGYVPGSGQLVPTSTASATLPQGDSGDSSAAIKEYLLSGQFLMMWVVFFFNIAAGISVISFQSSLLQEIWGLADPSVEPAVLANYGATLIAISSLFNGVGRLLWGVISDRIGRVESFRLLLASQMIVFGMLMTERNPWVFSALVCYILLCFGGGFGTMPSFVLDVFGSQRMSVMYGMILTAWAAAGIAGPLIVASLKDNYPDRAVIYCFLMGVLFLGCGFIFSFLVTNEKCKPGKPSLHDLGIPVAYLPAQEAGR
jgi:hypothetical protein